MDSEQSSRTPHSIGSAHKCCSSPLHQQLSLQLEHELLHADYEFDVIANIRLPLNQLTQEQQKREVESNASTPCTERSSYVGVFIQGPRAHKVRAPQWTYSGRGAGGSLRVPHTATLLLVNCFKC